MTHEDFMKLAIEEAEKSVREGNGPFGVVVVNEQGIVAHKDHDRQNELCDPTAHGEINAIRFLCPKLKSLSLKGYTFYTTSEPCPTCLTGMIKSKVSFAVFGAKTEASASLPISAAEIASRSKKYPIEVIGGILEADCLRQRERFLLP
ncbi:MAG: Cytidine/deoxycytidylate deaminase, zinc-binding region [uncultured bacterium]|nr:MAG: Cytidine/deoxycytidylate deaminase, zinc-binding region [uncultured bacterium]